MRNLFSALSIGLMMLVTLIASGGLAIAMSPEEQALINTFRKHGDANTADGVQQAFEQIDKDYPDPDENRSRKIKFLDERLARADVSVKQANLIGGREEKEKALLIQGFYQWLKFVLIRLGGGDAAYAVKKLGDDSAMRFTQTFPIGEDKTLFGGVHDEWTLLKSEQESDQKKGAGEAESPQSAPDSKPLDPVPSESKRVSVTPGRPAQDFAASGTYGRGQLNVTPGGIGGVENILTLARINRVLEADDDDGGFRRAAAGIEVLLSPDGPQWSPAATLGAINVVNSVAFRAEFADADLWRSTSFDPAGDTLFFQGLGADIAETVSLPATFDATLRDNVVDEFTHWGSIERRSLSLAFLSRGGLPDCEDTTVSTRLGFMYEWADQRHRFDARVDDYFPIASPGFDIRARYNEWIESSTLAATIGVGAKWNFSPDFYLAGNIAGRIGYSEADAALSRRMDINGSLSTLLADIDESEVTYGARARLAIGHAFDGGSVELAVAGAWANDYWVVNYAAGVPANLSTEERDETVIELRTQFDW